MANSNPSPATRFQPGVQAGPGRSRQKGERDRINSAFLKAYADEFEKSGTKVLTRLANEDPATFAKIGAALLPKEVTHTHGFEGMDKAELEAAIDALKVAIRAQVPPETPAVAH